MVPRIVSLTNLPFRGRLSSHHPSPSGSGHAAAIRAQSSLWAQFLKVDTRMRKWLCISLSVLCLPPTYTRSQAASQSAAKRLVSAVLVRKSVRGGAPTAQSAHAPATEVDFTWSYQPNLPVCTAARTKCYDGFTLTFANTNRVLATQSTLDPAARSYNWVPAGGVPYGSLDFLLVTNGYDESGTPVASVPAEVIVRNDVTSLAAPTVLPDLTGVPIP